MRDLPEQGFRGVNLTIPHKETALLSMDELDPIAQRIGSVNTVVVRADGSLEGRNTDVYGFAQNLLRAGIDVRAGPATILGAGGSARAVVVALQDMGAEEIRIVNRTPERAEALARSLGGMHRGLFAGTASATAMQDSDACWSIRPRLACRASRRSIWRSRIYRARRR